MTDLMDDITLGFFIHNFHNSSFDLILYNTVILLQDVWLPEESTQQTLQSSKTQLIIFREWWMCNLPRETDLIVISTLGPRTCSTLPEDHHKTLYQWHILRHVLSQDCFSVDFLHSLSKRVPTVAIPVWCKQL